MMKLYPDCFNGLGKFPGKPYYMKIDTSHLPKKTSLSIQQWFSGVSFRWDQACRACHTMNKYLLIILKKERQCKNKFCICLGPTNLTKAAERKLFYFRTLDNIFRNLSQGKVFTLGFL